MSIRTKILSALAVVVAVAAFAVWQTTDAPAKENPTGDAIIIATVNGKNILKKDINNFVAGKKGLDIEKAFPIILENLITDKLLEEAAHKSNVTTTKLYKERLSILKNQLAKEVYFENYLKEQVSDKTLKAEYETFKKDNAGAEERKARHILVSTESEARDVVRELDKGRDFAAIAAKRSTGPSAQKGGDLGWFAKDAMVPAFSDAAFGLKEGDYTKKAVQTQFGWHVIKIEDVRARVVPPYKDVEQALRGKLSKAAINTLIQDLRGKADIELFDLEGNKVALKETQKK